MHLVGVTNQHNLEPFTLVYDIFDYTQVRTSLHSLLSLPGMLQLLPAVIHINMPPKHDCCVVWVNRSLTWAPVVQGPGHIWLLRRRWVSRGLWRDWQRTTQFLPHRGGRVGNQNRERSPLLLATPMEICMRLWLLSAMHPQPIAIMLWLLGVTPTRL